MKTYCRGCAAERGVSTLDICAVCGTDLTEPPRVAPRAPKCPTCAGTSAKTLEAGRFLCKKCGSVFEGGD